jgi:hypothetical protein
VLAIVHSDISMRTNGHRGKTPLAFTTELL